MADSFNTNPDESTQPVMQSADSQKIQDQAKQLQDQTKQLKDQADQIKEQDEQIKGQDELMQGIIINIPTGLYVFKPVYELPGTPVDFRLVLLNPLGAQLIDSPDQACIGDLLSKSLPMLGMKDLLMRAIQVFQSQQTQHLETSFHRHGETGWFKLSISRYDQRLIVTTIDITALKQVQTSFQKVNDTMHTMLDGSLVAISQLKAVRDHQGTIIDLLFEGANKKWTGLLKLSSEDLVGQQFLTLFPDTREAIFNDYVRVIETGEPRRFENFYQAEPLNGWFDLSIVKNDDGVVVSYLDIKDRKAAEQQLETAFLDLQTAKTQADRDLIRLQIAEEEVNRVLRHEHEINIHQSQFITFVSHQFRNPMTGILLAAEALAKYSELSTGQLLAQKVAQYAQQTRQEIKQLDALLTKVLLQDNLHSMQITFQLEEVELVNYLENIIARQRHQHQDYQRVQFLYGQPLWAKIDKVILEQVVENLMSNALKYSAGLGKPVEVRVELVDNEICITVKDYGIGIPAEELEYVGKSFFRASNTSFISGIGLGLSLSRQFIHQHGGRLEVESILNQYTLCSIFLPHNLAIEKGQ